MPAPAIIKTPHLKGDIIECKPDKVRYDTYRSMNKKFGCLGRPQDFGDGSSLVAMVIQSDRYRTATRKRRRPTLDTIAMTTEG